MTTIQCTTEEQVNANSTWSCVYCGLHVLQLAKVHKSTVPVWHIVWVILNWNGTAAYTCIVLWVIAKLFWPSCLANFPLPLYSCLMCVSGMNLPLHYSRQYNHHSLTQIHNLCTSSKLLSAILSTTITGFLSADSVTSSLQTAVSLCSLYIHHTVCVCVCTVVAAALC